MGAHQDFFGFGCGAGDFLFGIAMLDLL